MPFPYRDETRTLDEEARRQAGGSFIKLPDGYTHYEYLNNPGLPARSAASTLKSVVLVHGFSVPYFIWDPTFEYLAAQGFNVLRYDLFGRGYSDRPRQKYNLDLFINQLHGLLQALQLDKIMLVGLSMGGAIASGFTAKYPDQVEKLILIDPIGTLPMPLSWMYKAAILPGVAELILGLFGTERMVKALASDFFDPAHVQMFQDRYRTQMQYKGFKRAILSTVRNKTVDGFPEIYARLGKLSLPILLIWGRDDVTLPIEQSKSILALVPQAEFQVIEGCGHIPHYEKPARVNPLFQRFLLGKD